MITVLKGLLGISGATVLLYILGTLICRLDKKQGYPIIRKVCVGYRGFLVMAFIILVLWTAGLVLEMAPGR